LWIRQRQARQEWLLLRVTTVVLVLLAVAMAVFIALMIAGYR
jgi:succinate dehydrogenase hydrophobic anchor subunit